MPLTPADVRNVAFNRPATAGRAFDADEVDAFLEEIERELVRLIEENNNLRAQAVRADGRNSGASGPGLAELDAVRAELDRARRERAAADHAFRDTRAELERARSRSGPVADEDRGRRGSQVLAMAQRTAEDHVSDARREADRLLSDARTQAHLVTTDAGAKAETLERDARQRHQEAISGLDAKRIAAQRQIDELARFVRDYRGRLRAYLESQLRSQPPD